MKFGRRLGKRTGNAEQDLQTLFDYIAYLTEQIEYNDDQLRRQMGKEKGESTP